MANKTLNGVRIQHLNASSLPDTFVPEEGEFIIYNKDESNGSPRIKIGDGTSTIASLPFLYYSTDEIALDNELPVSSDAVYAAMLLKLNINELPNAINSALSQAHASGEFDGADGEDGYTPVRGTDYWTEADKAEIKSYVDEAILGGAW